MSDTFDDSGFATIVTSNNPEDEEVEQPAEDDNNVLAQQQLEALLQANPLPTSPINETLLGASVSRRTLEQQGITRENIYDNLILPPPIYREVRAVGPDDIPDIPGEIKLSEDGKLLRRYLTYTGFNADYIEAYNEWVRRRIPAKLSAAPIKFPGTVKYPDKHSVYITQVYFESPKITAKNITELTPKMARDRGITYASPISVEAELVNDRTGEVVERSPGPFRIGSIPVMIGSMLDPVASLSPKERSDLGECNNEPSGYFLINGKPYVILAQEHLRLLRINIYDDNKGTPNCRYIDYTIRGTESVILTRLPKTDVINIKIRFLGEETINVFYIFQILGIENLDDIIKRILLFVSPKAERKVFIYLQATKINTRLISNIYNYISKVRNEFVDRPEKEKRIQYTAEIISHLFPRLPASDIDGRLNLLAMMVAHFTEYLVGERQAIDRDSWSNKMVDAPSTSLDNLFEFMLRKLLRGTYNSTANSIDQVIKKEVDRNAKPSLEPIISMFYHNKDMMLLEIARAFTSKKWCVSGYAVKDGANVTEPLSNDTLLAQYSHMSRVSAPFSKKGKTTSPRMVSLSQVGYIDTGETPEGQACGVNKYKAVTCWFSVNRPEKMIRSYLEGRYYVNKTSVTSAPLMLNGKFLGWTNQQETARYLRTLRREQKIDKDIAIVATLDNILWVYSDHGRATRPLLVVDDDGQLVIKKKNLMGASFDKILSEGAIEYLDAWEQEYSMLARSINDLEQKRMDIQTNLAQLASIQMTMIQMGKRVDLPKSLVVVQLGGLATDNYTALIDEKIDELTALLGTTKLEIDELSERMVETINATLLKQRQEEMLETVTNDLKQQLIIKGEEITKQRLAFQQKNSTEPGYQEEKTLLEKTISEYNESIVKLPELIEVKRLEIQQQTIEEILNTEQRLQSLKQSIGKIENQIYLLEQMKIADQQSRSPEGNSGIISLEEAENEYNNTMTILNKLYRKLPYTHCEIDPNALFGYTVSMVPLPNHFPAPKTAHASAMLKQALSFNNTKYQSRFETTSRALMNPTRPMFETQMAEVIGFNDLPSGQNVKLAIMSHTGYNQEDSILLNQASVDRGLFMHTVTRSTSVRYVINKKIDTVNVSEERKVPEPTTEHPARVYAKLDERGVIRVNSPVQAGDCLIARIRRHTYPDKKVEIKDASEYAKKSDEGVVELVLISEHPEHIVKVKIRQTRYPVQHDKVASRAAQKSTIGLIVPDVDMPFTPTEGVRLDPLTGRKIPIPGTTVDMIINPHAIPSRMTINQLIEMTAAKYGALVGERVNASAFQNFNLEDYRQALVSYGFSETGFVTMYNGMTGKMFPAQIFEGPCYYQLLKHLVRDKIQARGTGRVDRVTRQPISGRAREGGIRLGHMERDAIISHGGSALLQERLLYSCDYYKTVFCSKCGKIAVSNIERKQYSCKMCGENADFGTCEISYATKYLVHLLGGMGVSLPFKMKKKVPEPREVYKDSDGLEEVGEAEAPEQVVEGAEGEAVEDSDLVEGPDTEGPEGMEEIAEGAEEIEGDDDIGEM